MARPKKPIDHNEELAKIDAKSVQEIISEIEPSEEAC